MVTQVCKLTLGTFGVNFLVVLIVLNLRLTNY